MDGLFIWAHSYCRSTLAFYQGLGSAFNVPLKIFVLQDIPNARKKTGFSDKEFQHLDISQIKDYESSVNTLIEYKDYFHIFGSYQNSLYTNLIKVAIAKNIKYGIASEAPCNMTPYPKRILKTCYLKFVLPHKIKDIVNHAHFIINYSGDKSEELEKIGWQKEKIIPCGYYSPALEESYRVHRNKDNWQDFTILLSGIHQWHRSPMVLLRALSELHNRGNKFVCNITQEGPLLDKMKSYVLENKIPNVNFLGFLPMPDLIHLYETCSVYVGAGNYEPWGMRLNDALQCGAPLIINEGMGGCKLVKDYNCGLIFERNDSTALANALEKMIKNYNVYQSMADNAYIAADKIKPSVKSVEIANIIKVKFGI